MNFFQKNLVRAAVALCSIAIVGTASAAVVSVSDLQVQSVAGQNFNFAFAGLAASDGAGGTLVLHAQGDYENGGFNSNEFLDWSAEGVVGANGVGNFNGLIGSGGPFDFVTLFQPLGNIEFQRSYALSGAELDALLVDGIINVFVDLASGVGLFNPPNFVEISINYNSLSVVPLPAALPLYGAGLAVLGLIGWHRKRKAKPTAV